MHCPACDASVELDQPVCGNCGRKLPRLKEPSTISALWDDVRRFCAPDFSWPFYNPYARLDVLIIAVVLIVILHIAFWRFMLVFDAIVVAVVIFLGRRRGPDTLNLRD